MSRSCRVLSLVAALVLPAGAAAAQAPAWPGRQHLERYLAKHRTEVGICAVEIRSGQVLLDHRAQTPMIPASTQKLVTSAVAGRLLGAQFQFRTVLATVGNDLAVIGDGDPALGDPFLAGQSGGTIYDVLDAWAAQLRTAGVTVIPGDLVLDDSIFQAGRHGDWPGNQSDRWYCAPAGGLNYNNNCLDITLTVTAAGQVRSQVSPASRHMPVGGSISKGTQDLWSARLGPLDAGVTLSGQVSRSMSQPLSRAVNEPALLLGRTFLDRLERAGIELRGQIVRREVLTPERTLPAGARVLAVHSTPLPVAMARMNKRSLNMAAECILLRATAQVNGQASYASAAQAASEVLAKDYQLDPSQFTVADGSGMSRANRITPAAMATLLRTMAIRPETAALMRDTLAVAGVDGTLDERFTNHPERIVGKTGSLAGVKTLAGYVLDRQGNPVIAFAFFCNNVQGGNGEAKALQDAVIAEWIRALDSLTP